MADNGTVPMAQASEQLQPTELLTTEKAAPESIANGSSDSVTAGASVADISDKARDLTSQVLEFLSHASNETLGACVVGLVAVTWLILGRLGLVLIGMVGGVVLHATWERNGQGYKSDGATSLEARGRREKGLDIAGRVLDWREKSKAKIEQHGAEQKAQRTLDFSEFQPETGAALTGLTDAVVRDYVKYVGSNEKVDEGGR